MKKPENTASATSIQKSLGAKIRAQRLKHDMKIAEIAELTGLTASTISQVERALISPSISTLKKICDAMRIPIGILFEDNGESEVPLPPPKRPDPAPPTQAEQDTVFSLADIMKLWTLSSAHQNSPVVRKEKRKFLSPGPGVRYYLLTPNMAGPLELIYNEYDPGASTGPEPYTHPGVESGLILSGELEIQINSEVYTLKEGDSITFNSSTPHAKRNVSNVICTCVWVNTPPWF
ncbi:MAG: cupin domain-containing protein [Spirochaetaceae bacterium]|jgi:transcriptional regulator with XRE-family HTH domain|nr:cupin domain-containing protein [Spirochaetaceae bacterium]